MASSPSFAPSSSTQPRFGSETPRVFTPPLRELTPETSLGFAVIEFADEVVGIKLHPWQRWLYVHALELLDDGSLRFRVLVILVARQNGKSLWSQILALFFMYVLGRALVIGTAQDLDLAEEIWQGAVEIVEGNPELNDLKDKVVRGSGKKSLELKTGERWKVKAANRRAGRGLSGDLVLLDELREHQTWDAWGAITKTTMARNSALIAALSNAGDVTSIVLRYLRKMAHLALGDPDGINATDPQVMPADEDDLLEDDHSLGIFEWSAPAGCSIADRDGWSMANPSLGYTITERTIASAARTDPDWVFRTEVLCQWSDGGLHGPFPAGAWERCVADLDSRMNPLPGEDIVRDHRVTCCLDVSWDRSSSYVAVAGRRPDGEAQVQVIGRALGTNWVIDWFLDRDHPDRATWPIVIQVGSPAWALAEDLIDAGLEVVEWKSRDLSTGCAQIFDAVRHGKIRHLAQPVLNLPAATAVIKSMDGDAWAWDRRRSPQDASPLVAATGAHWLLLQHEQEPPPPAPMPQTSDLHVTPHDLVTAGF